MNGLWTSSSSHPVTIQLIERWPSVLATIVFVCALAIFYPLLTRQDMPKNAPRLVAGIPLLGAVQFFTTRLPFVNKERSNSSTSRNFSFFLGRFPIISLGGPDGRATLLEAKDTELNLTDGYSLLLNGRPPIKRPTEKHIQSVGVMSTRIKTKQLLHCLPDLVNETQTRIKSIVERCKDPARDAAGAFQPLDELFTIAYALLLRQFGANEILRDPELLARSHAWVQTLIASQSVTQIIFPWIGKFLSFKRTIAGIQLFRMIAKIEKTRKQNDVKEDDWLQQLMDGGYNTLAILSFMLGALFAGATNTTIAACYVPSFVMTNEKWYKKLQDEVDGVVARHRKTPSQTTAEVLATLPLSSWEEEFPVLQLCLHETLRFIAHNPMYRRNNSGGDIPIGKTGEVIPSESYVVLTLDEVHADESIYRDPVTWDPSRFQGDAPEGQSPYSYIGWGAGRHTCVGMRFAKMLESIIIAHLFASFKLEAVDEQGSPISKQPGADGMGVTKEGLEKVMFKFQVRENSI